MTSHPSPYIRALKACDGSVLSYFSLPALAEQGFSRVDRLPIVVRLLLESAMRNCDGNRVLDKHIGALAGWQPRDPWEQEIPFVVSRVLLQDFTGIPLLTDLATLYHKLYADVTYGHEGWSALTANEGLVYDWPESTYAAESDFSASPAAMVSP